MLYNQNRISYIDVARGITIFLMVLGHCSSTNRLFIDWVCTFHMPFFFITTGSLYGKRYRDQKNISFSFKNKFKTLIIPYIFWNGIYQLFLAALAIIGGENTTRRIAVMVKAFFGGTGSAMWFLPTMFIATLFFFFSCKKPVFCIPICCTLVLLGLLLPLQANMQIESVLRACVGCFFICVGYYAYILFTKKANLLLVAFVFIIDILIFRFSRGSDLSSRTFINPPIYILNGCVGSWLVMQFSMVIESVRFKIPRLYKLLSGWGEGSIIILCLHGFLLQIIRLVDLKLFKSVLPKLGVAESFIFASLIMGILTIFTPLIERYFGWSFGRKTPPNKERKEMKEKINSATKADDSPVL